MPLRYVKAAVSADRRPRVSRRKAAKTFFLMKAMDGNPYSDYVYESVDIDDVYRTMYIESAKYDFEYKDKDGDRLMIRAGDWSGWLYIICLDSTLARPKWFTYPIDFRYISE